jgi:hypothetical protein
LQPEGTVTTAGAGEYPDHRKRRAAWLEANTGGAIACEGHQVIARLDGEEIARRPDLGRLMDRLDYLGGPYGNAADEGLVPGPRAGTA